MSEITKARAERCVTHHEGCYCREYRLQQAEARIREMEAALRFYARHEHWMEVSEGSEARTLLIACGPSGDPNGWAEAERALSPPDSEPRVPEAQYVGIATGAPGEGHCTLIRNYMELRSWVRSMFWSGPPEEEPEDVKEIVRSLIDPDYWVADVLWSFTTEGDGTVYVAKLARAIAQPEQQDAMLERREALEKSWDEIKDRDPYDPLTQLEIMREKAEREGCGVAHQYNVIRHYLSRTSDEGTGYNEVAGEVYQAVGVLLSDAGRFDDPDGIALLDACSYLAGNRDNPPDSLLPFESKGTGCVVPEAVRRLPGNWRFRKWNAVDEMTAIGVGCICADELDRALAEQEGNN